MLKETGIIMSGDHPLKCLDGTKTQTRRVIVPQPWDMDKVYFKAFRKDYGGRVCPFGGVEDRLWVRETWAANPTMDDTKPRDISSLAFVYYKSSAQGSPLLIGKWRPSLFMPRWASRILLEITEIRVERLQEITEEDARAEGIDHRFCSRRVEIERKNGVIISGFLDGAKARFSILWDSLNAKRGYGWETNPWVWVITFKKLD